MESLPKRALTEAEVDALNESDSIQFIKPVVLMKGTVMPGVDDSAWGAEEVVIATESGAKMVSLYEEYGWVVDFKVPLDCDCCTPKEHGKNVLQDSTKMMKREMRNMMGDDPALDDLRISRWPAENLTY